MLKWYKINKIDKLNKMNLIWLFKIHTLNRYIYICGIHRNTDQKFVAWLGKSMSDKQSVMQIHSSHIYENFFYIPFLFLHVT